MNGYPSLSILIPTVAGREEKFNKLHDFIQRQIAVNDINSSYINVIGDKTFGGGIQGLYEIEIISYSDNKEISIGEKRNRLYKLAHGKFSWMIDDDDWTHHQAIKLIIDAIKSNPEADCIGFKELCIYNGKRVESSNFSLKYKEWADNYDGFNHVRTPFHKTPIATKLCQSVGVKDMRYGEDHEFAKDIYPLLETEVYIDEFIYHYRHNDSEEHNEKYGIKE